MKSPQPVLREPMIRAPAAVIGLVVLLIALHAWRVLAHSDPGPLALTAADIAQRRWLPLLTYMFTHASWPHVLTNAAFCLVFGTPVGRLLVADWAPHVTEGDTIELRPRPGAARVIRLGHTTFYERARRKLRLTDSAEIPAVMPGSTLDIMERN